MLGPRYDLSHKALYIYSRSIALRCLYSVVYYFYRKFGPIFTKPLINLFQKYTTIARFSYYPLWKNNVLALNHMIWRIYKTIDFWSSRHEIKLMICFIYVFKQSDGQSFVQKIRGYPFINLLEMTQSYLKPRSHTRADQPPLFHALEKWTDWKWVGLDRGERMLV